MKLQKIEIENFRCFQTITLDLHPEMTVLIAPNGSGKTALLDAARIALWPFVKAFDLGSQTGKSATIQINDVRLELKENNNMEPCLPSTVNAVGTWSADMVTQEWMQTRARIKPGTNTLGDQTTKHLTKFGEQLQAKIRGADDNLTLPLVAYLGTGRLWYEGRYTSLASGVTLDKSAFSRLSGYLNCLTLSSSFKQFADWYGWIYRSYREAQLIALEKGESVTELGRSFEQTILAVKEAVNCLIQEQTGWSNIAYSEQYHQQLVLTHAEHGVLPLEMLSDGLRNTVAMVADLAFRACKLNPHLGAAAIKQTHGIALIDEVDMFLHPSWQQTVLASLRTAFPNIQFIVTTHSPQVLSTVRRENIRVIGKNRAGQTIAEPPFAMTYGEPSGDVMHSVMHVDPQPPVPEKQDLQRLTSLVDQGHYKNEEARQLMQSLNAILGEEHPQLQRLQLSIQRQEFFEKNKPH
jgi:predicted ATP-binding protein involved in virulence